MGRLVGVNRCWVLYTACVSECVLSKCCWVCCERSICHERYFALFNALLGPDKGPVMVYMSSDQSHCPKPPSHSILVTVDPFEPHKLAPHFSSGEEVWREDEVEIVVSYMRLWRAYLRPTEGRHAIAPLRLRTPGGDDPSGTIAWGSVTWDALARASWDVAELLTLIQEQNATVLEGLVAEDEIVRLSKQRYMEEVRSQPLLSSLGNNLAVNLSLSAALRRGVGRPLGLHRQAWLNRLATRFWSG